MHWRVHYNPPVVWALQYTCGQARGLGGSGGLARPSLPLNICWRGGWGGGVYKVPKVYCRVAGVYKVPTWGEEVRGSLACGYVQPSVDAHEYTFRQFEEGKQGNFFVFDTIYVRV